MEQLSLLLSTVIYSYRIPSNEMPLRCIQFSCIFLYPGKSLIEMKNLSFNRDLVRRAAEMKTNITSNNLTSKETNITDI